MTAETDPIAEAWGVLYSLKDKDYPMQYLKGVQEFFSRSDSPNSSSILRRNFPLGERRGSVTMTTSGALASKLKPKGGKLFSVKLAQKDGDRITVVSGSRTGVVTVDGRRLDEGGEFEVKNGRCVIETLGTELILEAFYDVTARVPRAALGDDFRLMSVLGRGGHGIVYKAFDARARAFCVVKTSVDEEEELAREFECLRRLDHPAIIKALDYRRSGYASFMITEIGDGGSLYHRIKRGGRMGETSALRLLGQIVDALCYLHAAGLVHRDLKPHNIVLTSLDDDDQSAAKLIDFGLCARASDKRAMRMVAGSGRYMAPETLYKEVTGVPTPTSCKVDVWGVGVCLYVALTRRHPFEYSSDRAEYMSRMMRGRMNTEAEGYGELTPATRALLSCCLQSDPAERASSEQLRSLWRAPSPSQRVTQAVTSSATSEVGLAT